MSTHGDASKSGPISGQAPNSAQRDSRPTALEIFAAAARAGEEGLKRSSTGLAVSGLAAGLNMGLTALGAAVLVHAIGPSSPVDSVLAALLYPLGFVVVVLGRSQLFTENTLFPVILVLDRKRYVWNTLRLWVVVFAGNIVGTLMFALLLSMTPALSSGVVHALGQLAAKVVDGSFGHVFWAGVIGGWVIALMAWLVTATRSMVGQFTLVYLMTFVVGAAQLAHCIAGSAETLSGVLLGTVSIGSYLMWLLAATLGNTIGGVLLVAVLNYGQVIGSGQDAVRASYYLDDLE